MKKLLKKYKELILYVVFGALTTLVNYVVYFGCKALHIPYQPCNSHRLDCRSCICLYHQPYLGI